ncbi:hypothetical protein CHUAL_009955 [Chamberlinius hualienensis]
MVKFSEEKYLPISAIKNRINCLVWVINELITNDHHFNIGNYIPIDETIFLMQLGQSVFDMTNHMCQWILQKETTMIDWKETPNSTNQSNYSYISLQDIANYDHPK